MTGFDWLACPHCREPLTLAAGAARCPQGHAFDQARQGYLNLLGRSQGANADSPEMVARRVAFLEAGFYAPITDAIVTALPHPLARIVDCGAGTGWHLARVCEALTAEGLGIDVSVAAARRLAKCSPRVSAIVADVWTRLPLQDGCTDAVLSIFAPRNVPEFARILRPSGVVVTVTPRPGHLAEAREAMGLISIDPEKDARLEEAMAGKFTLAASEDVDVELDLDAQQASDLVGMGPNALHTHGAPVALRTQAQVSVRTWKRC